VLRETRAKWLALGTATLVALMALAFAALRNAAQVERKPPPPVAAAPAASKPSPPVGAADPARIEAGRRAFERLQCTRCHAAEGKGNRDSSLDGIGARMNRAEIREWATGSGAARDYLAGSAARQKARLGNDPDIDAVIEYLAQLK
jgi:mono/diheme cytochrome c family protein